MNRQNAIRVFLSLILILVIAGGILFASRRNDAICSPIFSAAQSKEKVDSLDKQSSQFASTTANLMGRSAEGGAQITFSQNGNRKIVEQRFYGETGKSYMRFYYDNDHIFEIVKLNSHMLFLSVPIAVEQ